MYWCGHSTASHRTISYTASSQTWPTRLAVSPHPPHPPPPPPPPPTTRNIPHQAREDKLRSRTCWCSSVTWLYCDIRGWTQARHWSVLVLTVPPLVAGPRLPGEDVLYSLHLHYVLLPCSNANYQDYS